MPRRRLPQIVFTLTRWYTIVFLTFVSFLAARGHGMAIPKHLSKTTQVYAVFWLDLDTLLVRQHYPDKDWIYSISTYQQFSVPGLESYRHIATSPNGLTLSVVDDKQEKLRVFYTKDFSTKSPRGHSVRIPALKNHHKDSNADWSTKAFWIDNDRLYVERYDNNPNRDEDAGSCQMFSLTTKKWKTLKHCFALYTHPGFVTYAKLLGSDSYAIYSSAEGVVSVRIVRWNSHTGQANPGPNDIEIEFGPYAGGEIYFDNTEQQLYVLSVYAFSLSGTINTIDADMAENLPLKLYRWNPRDTKTRFAPTALQIPQYAKLHSVTSRKTAWVDSVNKQLCVRNPNHDAVCHRFKFE